MSVRPIAYESRAGDVYHVPCFWNYHNAYKSEIGQPPALPERLIYTRNYIKPDTTCPWCREIV